MITMLPMLFVLTTTLWALAEVAYVNLSAIDPSLLALVNSGIAILLIALALFFVMSALFRLAQQNRSSAAIKILDEEL